jgi:hypothetical protein
MPSEFYYEWINWIHEWTLFYNFGVPDRSYWSPVSVLAETTGDPKILRIHGNFCWTLVDMRISFSNSLPSKRPSPCSLLFRLSCGVYRNFAQQTMVGALDTDPLVRTLPSRLNVQIVLTLLNIEAELVSTYEEWIAFWMKSVTNNSVREETSMGSLKLRNTFENITFFNKNMRHFSLYI